MEVGCLRCHREWHMHRNRRGYLLVGAIFLAVLLYITTMQLYQVRRTYPRGGKEENRQSQQEGGTLHTAMNNSSLQRKKQKKHLMNLLPGMVTSSTATECLTVLGMSPETEHEELSEFEVEAEVKPSASVDNIMSEKKRRTGKGYIDEDYHVTLDDVTPTGKLTEAVDTPHRLNITYEDVLSMEQPNFLSNYKNPCWVEELLSSRIYQDRVTRLHDDGIRKYFSQLQETWARRFRQGHKWRLRCLPYFYIAGIPKSGTTDLYVKLALHPSIVRGAIKESHWWTRKRLGRAVNGTVTPFNEYVDLFDNAAECMRTRASDRPRDNDGKLYHDLITGDASASTFWDSDAWRVLPENEGLDEPRFVTAHYIWHMSPVAKIIVILRNPAERLYSDYLYFRSTNTKSPQDFHRKAVSSVTRMQECLLNSSARACVYSEKLAARIPVRLRIGMYAVFLSDWLQVFPRDQIHLVRLEDYSADPVNSLNQIFSFLEIDALPQAIAYNLEHLPKANARHAADQRLGPMLPETKAFLDDFYRAYNEQLAELAEDNRFLWRQDELNDNEVDDQVNTIDDDREFPGSYE